MTIGAVVMMLILVMALIVVKMVERFKKGKTCRTSSPETANSTLTPRLLSRSKHH